ncbi:MAG: RNA polymerase subunit sigma-70, partial [Acidobacteria bacterium]|nr:RNA polymerase subunit sigma-70 [Acidobacteriota bacterium]
MQTGEGNEITALLSAWRGGDEDALAELMPLVYARLKKIAGRLLLGEPVGGTLQTTALVHEAYLRVADLERIDWKDRAHFYSMCARIMRRVLVDSARHHRREKRGGALKRLEVREARGISFSRAPDLLALDDALKELAEHDAEMARIVELRFFG